ncbi:MAG TPA: trypco2 family protein [Thermoanaerobaculia bacterium]|nr:trypco2 family protein [Thermoanaerobaculia bacterium]
MRLLVAVAALSLVACVTTEPPPGASLDGVLEEVQSALQKSQDILAASNLPKLQSVELKLQTQAGKDATGKVAVLFVTLGGGAGASTSQELTLLLTPPEPRDASTKGLRPAAVPPPRPADSIVELIKAAAQAVKAAEGGKPPLEAKSLTLDLAFTVTQSVGGGLQFNVGVVSADASGNIKSSTAQRIKITFSREKR